MQNLFDEDECLATINVARKRAAVTIHSALLNSAPYVYL